VQLVGFYRNCLKRIFDIFISVPILIGLLPLFWIVALMIKVDSPGEVFFRGVRVGREGKPFRIFKLRTMVIDAENRGGPSTAAHDPRITRVGKWIRRFNLDELPQFINVLKGEMSIVGPRPEVPQYVEKFTDEERAILSVRPGITDWATLWVRDEGKILEGSKDPEKAYMEKIWPEKHRLAIEYVKHQSLLVDFQIMAKTLKVHLFDRLKPRRQHL